MKSIFFIAKKTYSDLLNYKLFLTLAVYTIYDCYLLTFLKGYELSRGEFILYSVTDQYVIVYFFSLMLSFNILHYFNFNDDFWKIRAVKKRRYYAGTILGIAGNIVTAVSFQILIAFLLSRGYRNENIFIGAAEIDTLFKYPDYFQTPVGAAAVSAFFLAFGLTVWFFLMLVIHQVLSMKCMLTFWLLTYLSMVFGAQMADVALLKFSLDKFLILYFSIEHVPLMFFLQICIFLILFAAVLWNKKKSKLLRDYVKKIYYVMRWNQRQLNSRQNCLLLAVIVLVNIMSLAFLDEKASFPDLIAELFSGVSPGYFSLMDFIRMLVINAAPVYLTAAYLQKQVIEADGMIEIRLKSAGMSLLCKFAAVVSFLTVYLFSYVAAAYLICFLQNRDRSGFFYDQDMFYSDTSPYRIIFCAATLRLLELLTAVMLVWLCCNVLQSAVTGVCLYIGSGLFYFFKGVQGNLFVVLGISGLARFSGLSEQTGASIKRTFVWCMMLCGILAYLCCKTARKPGKGAVKWIK